MASTDTQPRPVQVGIPADLLQHIEHVVAASRAGGRTLTLDMVIEAALRDWLAAVETDQGAGEAGVAAHETPIPSGQAIAELQAARFETTLAEREREGPAEWAARAAELESLFAGWLADTARQDPAALEAEWEEFRASVNAERIATGEAPLYT